MERVLSLLCVFVGCFVAAQSVVHIEDSTFPLEFSKFFEDVEPFPFERDFVPLPYDTIFSSWPKPTPDFHLLDKWPSILDFPRVEVSCDGSRLTVLVGKVLGGITLTEAEVQLGDGCYRTRELPNQFVFIYNLDECGTSRVMQNGLEMFTNSLHINDFRNAWWKSPSTVDISCVSRPDVNTNLVGPHAPPEYGTSPHFDMRAVNSLWTGSAESNVYKRGQIINLQVSANTRPEQQQQQQQLFIRSCFVSASPEPYIRPRHAVIMNKGCTAWFGSPHSAAQFLASLQPDVVNFALNTSDLISELYVHCSVFLSDQGVTFGSKSCSYNAIEARWKELSGASEVCECCAAKCKGVSVKVSEGAKSIVSAGPFVIIDQDVAKETSHPGSETEPTAEATDSMQSDGPESVDTRISGESLSRGKFSPRSVVVVRQEPSARLTLWHSGQVKPEERSLIFHNVPEHRPSTTVEEPSQETSTNVINGDGVKVLSLAVIPPHLEAEAVGEDSGMKTWLARLGFLGVKTRRDVDARPDEAVDAAGQDDFSQRKDEPLPRLDANDNGAVIRSKLQFTKAADGAQTLSYEEETVKPEDKCAAPGCGMKKHQELRKGRKLRATFLDFLRRMDGAE